MSGWQLPLAPLVHLAHGQARRAEPRMLRADRYTTLMIID